MLAVWALAGLGCLLGATDPVPLTPQAGVGVELLDLVRVVSATALVIALLLGPGIIWRAAGERQVGLAFLPLPGLFLLIATGGLAWLLAGSIEPRVVCFAVLAPVLGLMLGALLAAGPEEMLDPEEQRVLMLVSLALGVAIGRTIWSLSTVGELYEGTISRNLITEPRPDSRISYFIPQLIAHGAGPYSNEANYLYAPYNFSSRGPLPGLAAAPIVFLTGSRPGVGAPEAPWLPFDPQGFMAYRLAMMTFSCTALISLWELARRIGGSRAARLALILGISTPFFFADTWYTWPKLLGASFVLLGGLYIVERKPLRSGLLVGIGYLMHPSALLWLSGIGLLALWPLRKPNWRRPSIRAVVLVAIGVGVFMLGWRLLNGPHYFQGPFFEYVTEAYPEIHPPLGTWIHFRLDTLANTLVPLFLPLAFGHNISINTLAGISPGVTHFFFQYWTGVPFGFGIVFFPLLLVGLYRAARRWPWGVTATIFIPFVVFAIYWGASITGLLREGMQSWVLALLVVLALEQAAEGFSWTRSKPIRAILVLRAFEVLALCLGPVVGTHHGRLLSDSLTLNDAAAVAAMVGFSLAIMGVVWKETGRLREEATPAAQPAAAPSPQPAAAS